MGARQVQEGFFMYKEAMALRHITVIVHCFLKDPSQPLLFSLFFFFLFFFFGFNALLTQKIVTTVYKNRKVKREKKKKRIREKRIKPTHTARQYTVIA